MKYLRLLPFLLALFSLFAAPACRTKSGCEATESLKPKTGKNGQVKSRGKGKSGLFPKKMSKRMR
jgi:hypothetical protein